MSARPYMHYKEAIELVESNEGRVYFRVRVSLGRFRLVPVEADKAAKFLAVEFLDGGTRDFSELVSMHGDKVVIGYEETMP